MQKQKIEIYRTRSFSEKLSATFDFVSENGKLILKFLLYLLLPVSMIQALGMNTFLDVFMRGAIDETIYSDTEELIVVAGGYALLLISICVGSMLCVSMVYGLMKLYNERNGRLAGLTFSEFRPVLMRGAWRAFKLGLLFILVFILAISIIVGTGYLVFGGAGALSFLLLFYVILLVLCLPLSLSMPAYIMENVKIEEALSKSVRMGFKTWGGIFAVAFVLGIVTNIISGVSTMPWYIMLIAKSVFTVSDMAEGSGFVASPVYSFVMYLMAVVQAFFMYVGASLMYIGIGVQYGHAADKIYGVSVKRDVDNFENLADTKEDDSDLFAPKSDDIDRFETL